MKMRPKPSVKNSQEIADQDVNILKPPNWTVRKQRLMQEKNSETVPSLATHIDYHLDMLASIYKKSKKQISHGISKSGSASGSSLYDLLI